MRKQIVIILFAMSALVLLVSNGNAGCIPLAGGGQYCASWIRNSTDLYGFAKGLGKLECTDKGSTVPCPEQRGSIFGTEPPAGQTECSPYDLDCLITVMAICGPKKCLTNPNLPGCQNMDYNSVHFSRDQIDVDIIGWLDCAKNGNCKGLIMFLKDIGSEVCAPGHELIDAFAVKFYGKACFCEGGFNEYGGCLENLDCIGEFCSIDPMNSVPGTLYSCVPVPES